MILSCKKREYISDLGCEVPGRLSQNLIATPQLEVKLYTVGDTISFNCVPGYTLTGAAQITCQAGGGWSGAVPTCQRKFLSFFFIDQVYK